MKKTFLHILPAVIVVLIFFTSLQAQEIVLMHEGGYSNSSAFLKVSASIVRTYEANETTRLEFGSVFPNGSKSRIVISPAGNRKISGDIVLKDNSYSPARYFVSGDNTVSCKIVLPDSPTILTNSDNSKTLTVSDWSAEFVSNQREGAYNGKSQEVSLGATLYVGNKEENPVGVYDGTYAITFLYN